MDAMRLSKGLSAATVSASRQAPKERSRKVLSLNREAIRPSVRTSVSAEAGVIKILEQLLDEARGGEAIAGAIVLVRPDATICSAISAPHGGRHHLVAACDYLKQDIIAETDN
jgi:undecaprenyl pyrophosphate synthase